MRIVYVTQRLPFGTGESTVVPEVEALLAAGHEDPDRAAPVTREPVVHEQRRRALLSRTRALPGVGTILAAVAVALVRAPGANRPGLLVPRQTRPRRRAYSNAGRHRARAGGSRGIARDWRADHIHAHWAHLTATLAMGASGGQRHPLELHRAPLRRAAQQPAHREAALGALRSLHRPGDAGDRAPDAVGPDALERAVVGVHMGVALPPAPTDGVPSRADPILLCPARLVPVKGHGHLLEAVARLAARGSRIRALAGGGRPRAGRRRAAGSTSSGSVDRIRMLDTVPHAELLRMSASAGWTASCWGREGGAFMKA